MTPQEIESFVGGFDLTAANFSAPNFAPLVPGGDVGVIQGATPTFTSKSGTGWSLEGVTFTNSADQRILVPYRNLYEGTILAIYESTNGPAIVGGAYVTTNSFGMLCNGNRIIAYNPLNASPYTAAVTADRPHVGVVSFCPPVGKTYASIDDGTVVEDYDATLVNSRTNWHQVAIGGHYNVQLTGWVSRVLFFSRALHYRDPVRLAELIATEMEKIWL